MPRNPTQADLLASALRDINDVLGDLEGEHELSYHAENDAPLFGDAARAQVLRDARRSLKKLAGEGSQFVGRGSAGAELASRESTWK